MRCAAFLTALLGVLLGACSYDARPYNMHVYPREVVAAHPDTPYRHALTIVKIEGGEHSIPTLRPKVYREEFRKALESSLGLSRLLADPRSEAKFDLYIKLVQLKQPLVAFGPTVTARIEYRVIERGTNRIWFSDTVFGTYTEEQSSLCFIVYFDESCDGASALRLANEGAIRENIKTFIKRLLAQAPLRGLQRDNRSG